MEDRVGTSLKKCPTTPFTEEAPQSSAGPQSASARGKVCNKGTGVPVPGAGGDPRRGRVKRSGASRPRGREAPGNRRWARGGQRGGRPSGPRRRADSMASSAVRFHPRCACGPTRAGRGPRSRRGRRRPIGRLLQGSQRSARRRPRKTRGATGPPRARSSAPPGPPRPGVPPAAPATSGCGSPRAAAPSPPQCAPGRRPRLPATAPARPLRARGPNPALRTETPAGPRPSLTWRRRKLRPHSRGRGREGRASGVTWARRAGAVTTRGGGRGRGCGGAGPRRGWGPAQRRRTRAAESPRGSRFPTSSPGAADPAKNEDVKECVWQGVAPCKSVPSFFLSVPPSRSPESPAACWMLAGT